MQSIQSLMQQLERSPRWRSNAPLRQVMAQWPQLVGEAVAQHSQPTQLQRGILQVSVSSATWAQTLTFERRRILQKLHQQIPAAAEIQDIRFTTVRWQPLAPPLVSTAPPLSAHPSWLTASPAPPQLPAQSAEEAFQRWAQRIRTQLSDQSRCPRCDRPCPTQELQRWSACAICMADQWRRPQTR